MGAGKSVATWLKGDLGAIGAVEAFFMVGISGRSELSHGLLLAFAVWGRGDRTGPGPCAKLAEEPFMAPNLARSFISEA